MRIVLTLLLTAYIAAAQTTGTVPRSSVTATGQATVSVTPDQARIDASAVTQANTAQDAASQNASITANIIAQVKQALGSSGTVQTVSYSVNPSYNTSGTLTGYTVTNTIEIVLNDLTLTGSVIDATTQAGASRINSLQFTLKDDSAPRSQALQAATLKAKSKADVIAASVGLKTGTILVIQESGAVVANQILGGVLSATPTPILPSPVSVMANVTMQVELVQ